VRVRVVLQRAADSKVIGYVLAQGAAGWTRSGVIPANDELDLRARVCVPLGTSAAPLIPDSSAVQRIPSASRSSSPVTSDVSPSGSW